MALSPQIICRYSFMGGQKTNAPIKSKHQHLPPTFRANLRHLITFFAPGVGNLTFVLAGWGELNRKCKGFFLAPKSLTAINTCLDKMEEVKGRVLAIG